MTWTPNDQEIAALVKRDTQVRVEYFIHKVVDADRLILLTDGDDGTVLYGTDDGREAVPVWPHEKYALLCAVGPWTAARPEVVALSDWMHYWVPGMQRDGRIVAVFPVPSSPASTFSPEHVAKMLAAEDEKYS